MNGIKGLNVKKLNLKTNKIDFSKLRTRSEENNIRLRTKSAQSSNSGASGEAVAIKRISLVNSGKKPINAPGVADTRTIEVKQ